MDYQLLALIALIIAVVIAATRQHSRSWPGRPGWQYQRVFSVGFAGLLFFVSGVIGWDLSHSHGLFQMGGRACGGRSDSAQGSCYWRSSGHDACPHIKPLISFAVSEETGTFGTF